MMPQETSDGPLIEKRTLHAGTKAVDFKDGTKVLLACFIQQSQTYAI
jgi:hypothetical protein